MQSSPDELISQKLSRNKFQTEIDIPTFIDEKDISLIGKAVLVSSLELFAKRLAGIE